VAPLGLKGAHIGVYVGTGASHSWLWFVDVLERYGCSRISFLDEEDIRRWRAHPEILVISGGDTFAVADALGAEGADRLRSFIERGGLYIGSCAGAYLPLHSSKEPLHHFNFVKARIRNLTGRLPEVKAYPEKYATPYGCSFVFHPVRNEVVVRISEGFPIHGGQEIVVPVFGGPPLEPSQDVVPIARYCGFTDRTVFLADPEIGRAVFLGATAACEKPMGQGHLLLLGPHFEHPGFPRGNEVVMHWIQERYRNDHGNDGSVRSTPGEGESGRVGSCAAAEWANFLREISNARIRAWALERASLSWRIGAKWYEPEKILVFLEAIWKRRTRVVQADDDKAPSTGLPEGQCLTSIIEKAEACNEYLRRMTALSERDADTTPIAEALFSLLKQMTAAFLSAYFQCAEREARGY